MYADRYADRRGIKAGSLGLSLAINGAVITALIFAAPNVIPKEVTATIVRLIPIDEPPPPEPIPTPQPELKIKPQPLPRPDTPDPIVDTLPTTDHLVLTPTKPPVPGDFDGGAVTIDPPRPPAPPVLTDAAVDSRFAGDFQPLYPSSERRAGHEGRVTVRVRIGVDGRVKQVERLAADSDAFFQATLQRALAKWRFKPATRDGIPIESWRTMRVRFVLDD